MANSATDTPTAHSTDTPVTPLGCVPVPRTISGWAVPPTAHDHCLGGNWLRNNSTSCAHSLRRLCKYQFASDCLLFYQQTTCSSSLTTGSLSWPLRGRSVRSGL